MFQGPLLKPFLDAFVGSKYITDWSAVQHLAGLSPEKLDWLFRDLRLFQLWKPAASADPETDARIQADARRRRELVNDRLGRFRKFSLVSRCVEVSCMYCDKTPPAGAPEHTDEIKARKWELQHAQDRHFFCRVCDEVEKKKKEQNPSYKPKVVPSFPDVDGHLAHLEKEHKGKFALRCVDGDAHLGRLPPF